METILITGGTGLVGKKLTEMLVQKGFKVIILTRRIPSKVSSPGITYAKWDVARGQIDLGALQAADHIIHLAGAGVMDKKWTAAYKQEIIDSRIRSAGLLINELQRTTHKIKTLVSASAIGYYGPDLPGRPPFEETAPADTAFLGEVCRLWEAAADPAAALGIRVVKLRIGIVLSAEGGALAEFISPLRFGVATVLGNGRQVVSWIHNDDLCRLYLYAITNKDMHGVYNAVAPLPVTNRTLVTTVAELKNGNRYITIPVPSFLLKLVLGGRSIEVLKSATVSSKKTEASGFTFDYPELEKALTQILSVKDQH